MSTKTPSVRRRAALGVTLVISLCLTSTGMAYVLPVTDIANWIKNQTISLQTQWQNQVLVAQLITVRKMSRRLSEYVGSLRARYRIPHDDAPRWRIHDFESDKYLYGRGYLATLNYGDASGAAYDRIARPLLPFTLAPATPPAAVPHLRAAYATIELADALLRGNAHQAGQIRFNGRRLAEATSAFEADALGTDLTQSTAAVLDKLNAVVLLELRQKQTRNQLLAAALEVSTLDTKRRRDADFIAMAQRLRHAQHYRAYAARFYSEAAMNAMREWRQP